MEKGEIRINTENIFPIIKKAVYSDHEIFLRELVSNGVDAISKRRMASMAGDCENTEEAQVKISIDRENNTLTISDNGIGMNDEEIKKYINQVAFSSAEEFLTKYKKDNEEFNNNEYPATSPEEPPPVKLHQDIETIIELTPDEALNGASILIELEDETVVEVDTPPFAGDGWRLRLENIARGGKDHYLQLKVQTESGLRIDGLRVLYKLELFPHDALLGCAVEVPTLDGNVTLQVPPKSSTGRMLRLKGRGLTFEDNVGDQYVEILVVIPADINDEEIALYTRLQELSLPDS